MTVRFTDNPPEIFRIILDPSLKIAPTARVVRNGTIIIASSPDQKKAKELEKHGVRILDIPTKKNMFDWEVLWKVLTAPKDDFHGISSILVEGGAKTWEIFKKAGMVDEEVTLMG